ncbi:MAG: type II toxin-antitoxin system VapC family toxin [Armatimonadetes bacterium]|nr:type II toxin-antitoxin system VapC family toxin [Armatimonadota bacterium]
MSPAYVLDASAILAVLQEEPGAEVVEPFLNRAVLGVVNLAEVYSRLLDSGLAAPDACEAVALLVLTIDPMDEDLAMEIGRLRPLTRSIGLSLGDRACLALAIRHQATAVTADRNWGSLSVCPILLIRE